MSAPIDFSEEQYKQLVQLRKDKVPYSEIEKIMGHYGNNTLQKLYYKRMLQERKLEGKYLDGEELFQHDPYYYGY